MLVGCFEPEAKPWGMDGIPRGLLLRHAARGHGPLRAGAREGRGTACRCSARPASRPVLQRARELHAGRSLPAGRDAGGARPVRRLPASTRSASRARAAPARCWRNGFATAHPPMDLVDVDVRRMHAVPGQSALPARPHRRDARPALRDALAVPPVRDRARRAALAASTTGCSRRAPVYRRAAGWERPNWFAPPGVAAASTLHLRPAELVRAHRARMPRRRATRWRSSTRRSIREVPGPGARCAARCSKRSRATEVDVPSDRVVYTQWLNERGGIEADLTVTRDRRGAVPGRHRPRSRRRAISPGCAGTSRNVPRHCVVSTSTSGLPMLGVMGPKLARTCCRRLRRQTDFPTRVSVRHLADRSRSAMRRCAPAASPTSASWVGSCTSRASSRCMSSRRCDGRRGVRTDARRHARDECVPDGEGISSLG